MKYLTQEGLDKLKAELEDRKTVVRREIAKAIKEAKEQGDLSENAEYAEAKRRQRENEGRIMHLENEVRTSKVIRHTQNTGIVEVGSQVEVELKEKKLTFLIVGSNEASPLDGKISNESPIGKAFLGKRKDEKVTVILPNKKKIEYTIKAVK